MSTILVKKNDTAGHVPDASDLTNSSGGAELAVNTADGKLYVKNSSGEIVEISQMKQKKIAQFSSSGTWTVPAGVTYAIAHITSGGGGGANTTNNATAGGDSSVGFASGTVSSVGGYAMAGKDAGYYFKCLSGRANTGESATIGAAISSSSGFSTTVSSTEKVHGASVTPEEEITVTVGAGGAQGNLTTDYAPGPGTANGGSGYVWIEYYE
jgi:hypothetical protein